MVLVQLTKFLVVFFYNFKRNLHKQYVSFCCTVFLAEKKNSRYL